MTCDGKVPLKIEVRNHPTDPIYNVGVFHENATDERLVVRVRDQSWGGFSYSLVTTHVSHGYVECGGRPVSVG